MLKKLVVIAMLSTAVFAQEAVKPASGANARKPARTKTLTNAEFDASVGDMKASLDKLQVAAKEQKELLSILESTRPQIVQDR